MSGGFIITVQPHRDAPWEIEGWESDPLEAELRAAHLVIPPQMAHLVVVFEVGGTDALPTFTLRFQTGVTRQEQGKP